MRYAVVSDVHANLEALRAVLARIDTLAVDRILCLGDMVGYHSDPDECIALLRERRALCIPGNHDRAAIGALRIDDFGFKGRYAIEWTKKHLSDESRRFLQGLPRSIELKECILVHAGLYPAPNDTTRVNTLDRSKRHLDALARDGYGAKLCFFGHNHKPMVYERKGGETLARFAQFVSLEPDSYYLANPGTLGQPRDEDTVASFALFDAGARTITWQRVPFDRETQLAKAYRAGVLLTDEQVTTMLAEKKPLREKVTGKLQRIAGRISH